MTNKTRFALAVILGGLASFSLAKQNSPMGNSMAAEGKFDVVLSAQQDTETPAGRMVIKKTYQGAMQGSGVGQMISKRTANGTAAYYAIEEFSGVVDGKQGAFTLLHKGFMGNGNQTLEVTILEGSGSGQLASITGSLIITQDASSHSYQLIYRL